MDNTGDQTRKEILEFIIRFKEAHDGISPTLDEIREGTGLNSKQSVDYHVGIMIDRNVLYKAVDEKGMKRTLCVKGGSWQYVNGHQKPAEEGN